MIWPCIAASFVSGYFTALGIVLLKTRRTMRRLGKEIAERKMSIYNEPPSGFYKDDPFYQQPDTSQANIRYLERTRFRTDHQEHHPKHDPL